MISNKHSEGETIVLEPFRELAAAWAKHSVAVTDPMWTEGVKPDAIYPQDCYWRAYKYATHLARWTENGVFLVHGDCGLAFGGHAWVELPNGLVFDGVFQQFYPPKDILARPWYKYTPMAAFLLSRHISEISPGEYTYRWDIKLQLPWATDTNNPMVIDEDKALNLLVERRLLRTGQAELKEDNE